MTASLAKHHGMRGLLLICARRYDERLNKTAKVLKCIRKPSVDKP